ncbi:MAG TPA: type VI secretion system baseplate subunit TssG [Polyangiaceae bacterium]|jgi:type VI secretion system protein ImpH
MTFLEKLTQHPQRFDFHQTLRRLQNLFEKSPRWGTAAHPSDEPIRFGQDPTLAFGSSMLTAFEPPAEDRPGKLSVAFFGLFGPHGPLPLHLTEYARDRMRHSSDRTFAAFANVFNHRMLVLFQRAWATAQPTASHDRPSTDRFRAYIAALFGNDSDVPHGAFPGTWAKLQYAAHFANSSRHPSGLESLVADYFGVAARIEEFIGQWLDLPESSRFALGISAQVSTLGRTAVLGRRVYRCDQKFRLVLGPLSRSQFERLLPGGNTLVELHDLVRAYTCDELDWDVRLELAEGESDQAELARGSRLGWNARLGPPAAGNTEHVMVHPATGRTERTLAA